jgi:putative addiction module component (TIGR02574 family)
MARAAAEMVEEIRSLDPVEQGKLLRMLLDDLDGPADLDVDRAWLEEAQRRSRELDARLVTPIPAEEVFANARARLRAR